MVDLRTRDDLILLAESVELECKLAQGKNGQGELPKDFWPTYSAMANTHGGWVLLGIREKSRVFTIEGIKDSEKVRTDLFNTLNNRAKVSINLLTDRDVETLDLDGKTILAIRIPAASRKQKPVYLNGQPLGNCYRRLHEGDRHCDEDTVKRMLAEQIEDSHDTRILKGYGLNDLHLESLHNYRNILASHKPDHPWLTLDDQSFLRSIGGWKKDRNNEQEGLTLAGLLMFGQWTAIIDTLPLYFLDYQELPEDKHSDTRWLDRVVPDGTWSGNLFDFFLKVSRKLVADLKIPFVLQGNFRQDDTPIHRALREALVNTLVHADYTDRASLQVIKQPYSFVFRNPGTLRVPAEQALQGGESDCRNRTLHQMFLMINLGERAGSGLPKIRQSLEQSDGTMELIDSFEPYDHTKLTMKWFNEVNLPISAEKPSEKRRRNVGETSEKILAAIRKNKFITIAELAEEINISSRSIERNLKKLQEQHLLQRNGSDKGGYWELLIE